MNRGGSFLSSNYFLRPTEVIPPSAVEMVSVDESESGSGGGDGSDGGKAVATPSPRTFGKGYKRTKVVDTKEALEAALDVLGGRDLDADGGESIFLFVR